jgi:hypothetical protein
MRFFTPPPTAACYDGIDLHARTMYLVVLDRAAVRLHCNRPARPDVLPAAVAPSGPMSSSAARASTAGTGSPTPVRWKKLLLPSATPGA